MAGRVDRLVKHGVAADRDGIALLIDKALHIALASVEHRIGVGRDRNDDTAEMGTVVELLESSVEIGMRFIVEESWDCPRWVLWSIALE